MKFGLLLLFLSTEKIVPVIGQVELSSTGL
jgi:hypothetical protein